LQIYAQLFGCAKYFFKKMGGSLDLMVIASQVVPGSTVNVKGFLGWKLVFRLALLLLILLQFRFEVQSSF